MNAASTPQVRFPLWAKLGLALVSLGIIPVTVVGLALIDRAGGALKAGVREVSLAIAGDVATGLRGTVGRTGERLSGIAGTLVDTRLDQDTRYRVATSLVESSTELDHIVVYDADGTFIDRLAQPDSPPLADVNLDPRAHSIGPEMWVGPAAIAGDVVAVPLVVRIVTDDGKHTGYVGTQLRLRGLTDRITLLSSERLARGFVTVVDHQGRLLASSRPDDTALAIEESALVADMTPAQFAMGITRCGEFTWTTQGRRAPYVGCVRPVEGLPWSIVTAVDRDDAYASLDEMRRYVIGALVAALVLALLASLVLARGITRPLAGLVALAADIAARRWGTRHQVRTRDELAVLGHALHTAAIDLELSEVAIRQEEAIRRDLGRYLPHDVVERIVSRKEDLHLGGERREVTVLFADVAAFTTLAETLPPEHVVALMNELFTLVTEIVFLHGGTVDKFIGDSVMAVWGAPTHTDDHARRALDAAEDMQRWMHIANAGWRVRFGRGVELAIGINSGTAVVGNIGSERRMEYTAMGAMVNTAARLETLARPGTILTTLETVRRAGQGFQTVDAGTRDLPGVEEPVRCIEVLP